MKSVRLKQYNTTLQQSINMIKKYLSQIGDLFSEKIPYTSIGVRNFEKIRDAWMQ